MGRAKGELDATTWREPGPKLAAGWGAPGPTAHLARVTWLGRTRTWLRTKLSAPLSRPQSRAPETGQKDQAGGGESVPGSQGARVPLTRPSSARAAGAAQPGKKEAKLEPAPRVLSQPPRARPTGAESSLPGPGREQTADLGQGGTGTQDMGPEGHGRGAGDKNAG